MYSLDLTGERFGKLVALYDTGRIKKSGNHYWKCACDCGNYTEVDTGRLRTGRTKSCGCLNKQHMAKVNFIHGNWNERLHNVWKSMVDRCTNPKNRSFRYYGARGIRVCEEFMSYDKFKTWALSSGYDESAKFGVCTIDRIDVDGDYEPSNCRWVDLKTQANNRRNSKSV